MPYYNDCTNSKTMGTTSGPVTITLPDFSGVLIARSLALCVDHCLSFCSFYLASVVLSVLLLQTFLAQTMNRFDH